MPDSIEHLLVALAWAPPLVLLHEVGHGLAALALTSGEVSIGLDRGGLAGGSATYDPERVRRPRAEAWIAAAGPAVSLASAVILCVAWWSADPGFLQRALGIGAAMAAGQFLLSALPLRYGAGLGRGSDSDGRVIWRVVSGAPPGGVERELQRSLEPEPAARPVFVATFAIAGVLAFMVDPMTGVGLLALMAVALFMQRRAK